MIRMTVNVLKTA